MLTHSALAYLAYPLNRTETELMLLITPMLFLLYQVKMSDVIKADGPNTLISKCQRKSVL